MSEPDALAALKAADPALVTVGTAKALRESGIKASPAHPQASLSAFREARAIGQAIHDQMLIGASLFAEGGTRRELGDLEDSVELLTQCKAAYQAAAEGKRYLVLPLNGLGLSKRDLGDFDGSAADLEQMLEIARQFGDRLNMARALNNLGTVRAMQGNYAAAREADEQGLIIVRALGQKTGEAYLLTNIANTYLRERNIALATDYCLQSLKLKEQLGTQADLVSTLVTLANIYWQDRKYPEAMKALDRALIPAKAFNRSLLIAQVEASQGEVEMYEGHMEVASKDFEAALEQARKGGSKYHENEILEMIAELESRNQHYGEAIRDYDRVLNDAQQGGLEQVAADALGGKGLAEIGLGNKDDARKALEQSVTITEGLRELTAGGVEARSLYLSKQSDTYQTLIALDVSDNHLAEALLVSEREKGRALLDLLTHGKSTLSHELTSAEKAEEIHVRGRVTVLESRRQSLAMADKPDAARLAALNAQLETARADLTSFKERMYAVHPNLNRHRGDAHLITLSQTAALFPNTSTAMLEYEVTPDATYLFVITPSPKGPVLKVHTIPVTEAALKTRVAAFVKAVATRDAGFSTSAAELYRLLLAPARSELEHKRLLIVVPSGDLWHLPFQALRDPHGKYVLDSAAVAYAPSLSVLHAYALKRRQTGAHSSLVAFGDPGQNLPEAVREVKTVAALYNPAHERTFLGKDATRENFATWAGRYDIVHVATHGVFDDRDPMYSQVLLASGSDASKGKTTPIDAADIADMNLSAALVVLSACETAEGKVQDGEGLIGLSWSFLAAGSQAAIASQWRVESSSTTELMIDFHRNLQQQMGKAEALRRAELSVAHNPRYKHPFYWAGFVMLGGD
ncbi:MAG: CHAT domain-containing tetratricopeptide repeat protein [Acidobacteriota bacterium]